MDAFLSVLRQLGFPLELLLANYLFMARLNRRSRFWLRFGLCAAVNLAIPLLLPFSNTGLGLSLLKFFLLYLAGLGLILCCCDIPPMDALFCSICGYAVQHLSSSLCFLTGALLRDRSIGYNWYHPLQLCILGTVCFLAWHLAAKRLPEDGAYHIGASQSILSAAMVLTVTLVLNTFAGKQYQDETSGPVYLLHIACLLYDIMCCLFIIAVQVSRQREDRALRDRDVQERLWLQQKGQYELSRETIDIINHKCHDLKHQMAALEQSDRSNEERHAYLRELQRSLDIYDCSLQTGNEALDTVLTEKLLLCRKKNIELTCMADGAALDFMTPVDLYTLFGNALDNAIESVTQVADQEKRVIFISVFTAKSTLMIQIENYYDHPLTMRDGLPLSTKEANGYHGFGMKSIRYVAERYGGFLTVSGEDHLFLLRVTIPTGMA